MLSNLSPFHEDLDLVKNRLSIQRMKRIVALDQKFAHAQTVEEPHYGLAAHFVSPRIHLHAERHE